MAPGFRFDPPSITPDVDVCWVLTRAFGPPDSRVETRGEINPERVIKVAATIDLAARVGARTLFETLKIEVGPRAAEIIREAYASTAVSSLIVDRVSREIAETADSLGIPVIFLKGAALHLGGKVVRGARRMGDVDVLAPVDGSQRLQIALMKAGCRLLEVPETEHQLRFLYHRTGLGVEIHRIIPGVRIDGAFAVNAQALMSRGFVHRVYGFPERCFVPADEVVLAHLLVHGLAQHGMAPGKYPMSRMVADAQDLAAADGAWCAASRWILGEATVTEVKAVEELARRLGLGEDPAAVMQSNAHAGALLRHILAGAFDTRYAKSLKFRSLVGIPREAGRPTVVFQTLWRAIILNRAQVERLYGKPRTGIGYWGWRLWRPFDLVLRALRYGSAWMADRRRR